MADKCVNHDGGNDWENDIDLQARLAGIRHKIVVLSGKGGVGKSTVSVNLAISLAMSGKKVGLLDVDLHGPSVPTMLNIADRQVEQTATGLQPVEIGGLKVLSVGMLLRDRDDAVIWRGPMKMGVIQQFLRDVEWGVLDYLIVDSPPGTGDEPLSVCQLIGDLDGAVLVTTPQEVSGSDVRRSVRFCEHLNVPVLGVIENMAGFVCPHCGEVTEIFRSGAGQAICDKFGLRFLGGIPLDPRVAEACDEGTPFVHRFGNTDAAKRFEEAIAPLLDLEESTTTSADESAQQEGKDGLMKIAIPVADGQLSMHFGHCETFELIDVDKEKQQILETTSLDAPPHQPGLLPRWLHEKGANLIIAGGMGQRAQNLFTEQGIEVIVGAPAETPDVLVRQFLTGSLSSGENVCDH